MTKPRRPADAGPPPSLVAGGSRWRAAKLLVLAARPGFLAASAVPVFLGTAWGARAAGSLDIGAFLLALAAVLCVHLGANVLNDVFDELNGTDRANSTFIHPYTGGSRFIQNGVISVRDMARLGAALLATGAAFGVGLALLRGPEILLFGLAGAGLGVLYSAPPARLSGRGLGEAAIALGFGVLPVTGAAWLQSGGLHWTALLLSAPVSLWVAAIILVNEVPDVTADAGAGKRTLVVRLGLRWTRRLYLALHALALLAVAALAVEGVIPVLGVAVPVLLALAAGPAAKSIGAARGVRANLRWSIRMTLGIHAVGGLWLTGLAGAA